MTDSPPSPAEPVLVVGGGLAGCEAAWQAARRGVAVVLYEMKPERMSRRRTARPTSPSSSAATRCARAALGNAVGLLKEEMRRLGSLVMRRGRRDRRARRQGARGRSRRVRAGASPRRSNRIRGSRCARERGRRASRRAARDPRDRAAHRRPSWPRDLRELLGERVSLLLRRDLADRVRRLDRPRDRVPRVALGAQATGEGDYLNLPLARDAVRRASSTSCSPARRCRCTRFEESLYFEGCLPIEEMARRGPRDARVRADEARRVSSIRAPAARPHAVVQLRQEDKRGVALQPGRLPDEAAGRRAAAHPAHAARARGGRLRALWLGAPQHLRQCPASSSTPTLELRARPASASRARWPASRATSSRRRSVCSPASSPPARCAGAAACSAARATRLTARCCATSRTPIREHFQPMNVNYGLFPPLDPSARPTSQERRRVRGRSARRTSSSPRARSRVCAAIGSRGGGRAGSARERHELRRGRSRPSNVISAAERGLSPHTLRAYLSDVRQLAAPHRRGSRARRVDADRVRSFLASLHRRRERRDPRPQARLAARVLPLPRARGREAG